MGIGWPWPVPGGAARTSEPCVAPGIVRLFPTETQTTTPTGISRGSEPGRRPPAVALVAVHAASRRTQLCRPQPGGAEPELCARRSRRLVRCTPAEHTRRSRTAAPRQGRIDRLSPRPTDPAYPQLRTGSASARPRQRAWHRACEPPQRTPASTRCTGMKRCTGPRATPPPAPLLLLLPPSARYDPDPADQPRAHTRTIGSTGGRSSEGRKMPGMRVGSRPGVDRPVCRRLQAHAAHRAGRAPIRRWVGAGRMGGGYPVLGLLFGLVSAPAPRKVWMPPDTNLSARATRQT